MNSLSNTAARLWVSAAGLLFGLALGCNAGDENGSGANSCVAGQTVACACPGDAPGAPGGVQTCNAAGTFDLCQCGAATGVSATDGDTDDSEESDSISGTTGSDPDLCGNGFPDPGECSDPDGDMGFCPQDCGGASSTGGTGSESDTEATSAGMTDTGVVDVCDGVPIYVGNVPSIPSVWTNMNVTGFGAGQAMCQQIVGADGICKYADLLAAEAQGDLAALPPAPGTTFWVHREIATMYNGVMIQPAPTSRCADWTYPTNHINDGEYATVGAGGALTYTLDPAPLEFDPAGLQCNGESRAIPCCNACP